MFRRSGHRFTDTLPARFLTGRRRTTIKPPGAGGSRSAPFIVGCKAPLFGGRAAIRTSENRLKRSRSGHDPSEHRNEHEDNQMFAVIKTGGKQYRVAADDVITVDKVKGEPGEIIEFGEVLLLGGDNVQVGSPTVGGASVAGEVVDQGRGGKVIAFKKRRRQNSRRKRGHRQEFTVVRITEILTDGRKPMARHGAEAAAQPPQEASAESGAGAAEAAVAQAAPEQPAARRRAKPKPSGEGDGE
jgi:large subunit ribosomal protein L21